ncbi:hypothetical protein [Actinomadura vinacea]|uniref:hypothetical protein n=1 Tax=Actinomadura vinacea TaxID=115336 RepID=UPI0031D6118A
MSNPAPPSPPTRVRRPTPRPLRPRPPLPARTARPRTTRRRRGTSHSAAALRPHHPAHPWVGPDPLDEEFTPEALAAIVNGKRAQIKGLLRDQRIVAGIGNAWFKEDGEDNPRPTLRAGTALSTLRSLRRTPCGGWGSPG